VGRWSQSGKRKIDILMDLWYSMDIKKGRGKSDMDKESREFLEKKFLILAQKDDVEKMRQETKAAFRQVKEENKTQILEWKEDTKKALDQIRKEWTLGMDPLREEIRKKFEKLGEEIKAAWALSKTEIVSQLQLVREDGKKNITSALDFSRKETKVDIDRLNAGLEGITGKADKVTDEIGVLSEKMREGFAELKDELGSMIKFSFADLERKLNALEARVKALEKKVMP
jgi:uncharacterized phage infection (PIP) family protein YhgE